MSVVVWEPRVLQAVTSRCARRPRPPTPLLLEVAWWAAETLLETGEGR